MWTSLDWRNNFCIQCNSIFLKQISFFNTLPVWYFIRRASMYSSNWDSGRNIYTILACIQSWPWQLLCGAVSNHVKKANVFKCNFCTINTLTNKLVNCVDMLRASAIGYFRRLIVPWLSQNTKYALILDTTPWKSIECRSAYTRPHCYQM